MIMLIAVNHPSMSAKAITTQDAPAPVGPYNQAVLAGEWLYCSGQIPLDPATGEMVGNGDVAAETHQVLKNLIAVLKEAGATPAQVVRTTVFLADLSDFQTVNGIYAEVFGDGVSPARAWFSGSATQGSTGGNRLCRLVGTLRLTRGGIGWNWLSGPMPQAKLTIGELEAGYPMYCKALRAPPPAGKDSSRH